jgi:hypothetical protein
VRNVREAAKLQLVCAGAISDVTARCPRRVKRVGLSMRRSLPVFPYEQTSSDRVDWSVSCQFETCRLAGMRGEQSNATICLRRFGACT